MSYAYPGARILIFAREPRRGQVKTRLQAHLGAPRCLALYRAMLERVVTTVDAAGLAPWALWVSSNPSHEDFITLCNKKDIHLQEGAGLGAKMAHAMARSLAAPGVESVLVIGTDCPPLDADYLQQALAALAAGREVVLGPVDDGGYVLIGARQPVTAPFMDIDWGTERVLEQTRARLVAAGLSHALLAPLWDVDRPEDLARLRQLSPPLEPVRLLPSAPDSQGLAY